MNRTAAKAECRRLMRAFRLTGLDLLGADARADVIAECRALIQRFDLRATDLFAAPTRRTWSEAEKELLRRRYPHELTADLARELGRPLKLVYAQAGNLGLRKSEAFQASSVSGRILRGGRLGQGHEFKPGHVPWSKGTKGLCGLHPKTQANWFKPGGTHGRAAQLKEQFPLGSYRVDAEGYLQRKISEQPGPQTLRWKAVHRLVWEQANGPIPPGHAVAFKAGRKTTELALITPDALELVSRRELMARNTVHNRYPPEVARVVQLRGALTRQINRKAKEKA